jgi:hypothetical protein
MPPRPSLGLHTVFLARENIAYVKEWLVYHALLGFEHFYLYDNSGSIGRDGSTPTTNKYGINFFDRTTEFSDADIADRLEAIIADVGLDVTHLKWQPTDRHGRIHYGYDESVRHCVRTYGRRTEWIAFLDMDEFLFSPCDIHLPTALGDLRRAGCGRVVVFQKKFLDRFCTSGQYVTDIYDCIDGIDTSNWAPKNLVRVDDLILGELAGMHHMPVRRGTFPAGMGLIRFNHYNVNPAQLRWMKAFYRADDDFEINASDGGMGRYREELHRRCGA